MYTEVMHIIRAVLICTPVILTFSNQLEIVSFNFLSFKLFFEILNCFSSLLLFIITLFIIIIITLFIYYYYFSKLSFRRICLLDTFYSFNFTGS